jgi:hypothetical protein
MPFYLGLDVHSQWTTISGVDSDTGTLVAFDHVGNDLDSLTAVFTQLSGPL